MKSTYGVEGPITSPRNPLVRRLVKLDQDPKTRQQEGVHLVWGWRIVEESLEDPTRVERILVSEETLERPAFRPLLRAAQRASVPVSQLQARLLDHLCPGAGDQGLVALIRTRLFTLDQMMRPQEDPLLLTADRIQEPGNLGGLMRIGEAAGISGLLVSPGTVDPYHTRVARASAGAVLRLPVGRIEGPESCIRWCRDRGIRIVVTLPADGEPCHRANLKGPLLLVMGNEGEGVAPAWREAADLSVTAPLQGRVQSLNVTAAAAVLLYEIGRQRAGEEG